MNDAPTNRQRAAEEALRERESRLRSIIETAPDAIVTVDENAVIESFSPAAERLFGFSAAEVIGQKINILMPKPERDRHDQYLARYLRTGKSQIIGIGREVTGRRKDGTTFPMELAVGEARFNNHRIFTGFARDVSARRAAAAQARMLQDELRHVWRLSAMAELASALAHELNQPLTAVINYVQAARRMLDSAGGQDPARLIEIMDKAATQTQRAGAIIQRLRQFIEKGETERTEEDLNEIVEEASALALTGVDETEIAVTMTLAEGLPPVIIDRIQIQQVILNLVRNGIEALDGAGRRALDIQTGGLADGLVEVAVRDSGAGLPEAIAAHLFEPFVSGKPQGMGIGLSISRSIVEGHGGKLWAEANPDRGTTFRFCLPIKQSADGDDHG
ncbi:MAG: PAS domain S-box protein [Alphaproteobacteria bacterium]|jgi:two-component system sensor kinase FixL|nr:PAS domain S-box protein [Alphaproteobacteria bacterium]